jgi:hypothetical protein
MKFAVWPQVCTVLRETLKHVVNLSVHKDGRHPCTWILEILDTEAGIAEISMSCHHK